MSISPRPYDIAIVGAGICGLAHALAAARRGKRVIVIDRDAQANGASVRNFGFVTVTGQERGKTWERAMRSRDVWLEVAAAADIPILHRGLAMVARRPEARAVLEAFMATEMAEGCSLLTGAEIGETFPMLAGRSFAAALHSPHDLRVESRTAIPALARWLEEAHGVTFLRETAVHDVSPPTIATSRGPIEAEIGHRLPWRRPRRALSRADRPVWGGAALQAAHAAAGAAGGGMAHERRRHVRSRNGPLPRLCRPARGGGAATQRLVEEQGPQLENGVHLIVVQSADGSLVVGDSHHYAPTPDPFAPDSVDELILEEFDAVFSIPRPPILERWTGTYASAVDRPMFMDRPSDAVRLVMITSGTGASTSFAIAEETLSDLFD